MSAREDFGRQLAALLLPTLDGNEELAQRVADRIALMSWQGVRRVYEEVDMTTLGSAEARIQWANLLVATISIPVESGEYRKPIAGGWTALP